MNTETTSAASLRSWVPVPDASPFPIQNLPYGSFSADGREPRLGVAIGEHILDLAGAAGEGLFDQLPGTRELLDAPSLDRLLATTPQTWAAVRRAVSDLLAHDEPLLRDHPSRDRLLVPQASATMHLPFRVGDFADFSSGLEHATTMGRLFRPDSDGLLPQWRHIPMAYHGRSRTVVVSGTPIRRPHGLRPSDTGGPPEYGVSTQLDYEVELGCVLGGTNPLGHPVPAHQAAQHIFGFVLLNDWSARDIQRYEYLPFGPFAGKAFATSISPWVVTAAALAPWRVPGPTQTPRPADYLLTDEPWNLAVTLETHLQIRGGEQTGKPPTHLATASAESLYWNCAQWLAQATVSGGVTGPGDLLGSGTISGWAPEEKGCLAERTTGGANPVTLDGGETRSLLEDGDTVHITGWCPPGPNGAGIGFGTVSGTIAPARPHPAP